RAAFRGGAILELVRSHSIIAIVLVLLAACSKNERPAVEPQPQCRADVGDDVEMAGRTGVAGAKTGITTGVEGVKTFGSSAAGLVEGGKDEAKRRWRDGKGETKATAHEGAAETKKE